MTTFDQITLLATGIIAIYLLWFFYKNYRDNKKNHNLYYIIAFAVLLISGLLLISQGYNLLSNQFVVIAAAIIPLFLSLGLVSEFGPKFEKYYLLFVLLGLVIISITRFIGPDIIKVIALATIHTIAALVILITPIYVSKQGRTASTFSLVAIGGLLISIGGVSLALLKAGSPILSADTIFTILAPVLFLMSLSYAYGFVKKNPKEKDPNTSIKA